MFQVFIRRVSSTLLPTVLDSPRLMHSRELSCKSNSHKARTDFAARNTSGSCSARFWFTRLRIYTVVFEHALTVESSRVSSSRGETCTSNIACAVFTPRVRRWSTCAQVHARAYARPARKIWSHARVHLHVRSYVYGYVRRMPMGCGLTPVATG